MRLSDATSVLLTAFPLIVNAFSFTAYDLGFYGISPTQHYVSTQISAPNINLLQWSERCDNGSYVLISPRGNYVRNPGPVILDNRGNLIWADTGYGQITNLQVQQYRGEPYLTFWAQKEKTMSGSHSNGTYYLLDSSYEVAHTVSAVGADVAGDLHEFKITENNTALITIYQDHEIDCARLDMQSSSHCWINDCLFQEIDIDTGSLIFEWRASDHVPFSDSYKAKGNAGTSKASSYDWFHMNSIDKDPEGNYYISSRHLHTVFCISPSGDVKWTLGGKHSNFTDLSGGHATDFAWQHHANWHQNNTLTIFDNNGNSVLHNPAKFSRGIMVSLDLERMTATLLHTYVHPHRILAISQGSTQYLPDSGNVFVGWGNSPAYTEFTGDGETLCNAHYGAALFFEFIDFGWVKSYRSFKGHWVGRPRTLPDIKVQGGEAFVSWNGATEVAAWRLQTAESADAADDGFENFDELPRDGFESRFLLGHDVGQFVRIAALDAGGEVLAYSAVVDSTSQPAFPAFILGACVTLVLIACGLLIFRFRNALRRRLSELSRPPKVPLQEYELLENHEED